MKDFYSVSEARSIRIGLWVMAFIIIFACSYNYIYKKIELPDSPKSYLVHARFGRTDGLVIGDIVRIAGINIGRVVKSRLDNNFQAILTFEIADNIKIPDDSSASIVSEGILGTKYIEIEPGGSEDYVQKNGEISYTQDAMVLEELLERVIAYGKSKRSKKGDNNE